MGFQQLIGHAVARPINVIREKVTVIRTQTVLEALPAEPITVEQLELLEAIGVFLQIVAKVIRSDLYVVYIYIYFINGLRIQYDLIIYKTRSFSNCSSWSL